MKILALDSTASPASAALCMDSKVLSFSYINTGLTHSQTLLPMVENVLENSGCSLCDVDSIAVSNGPGSFTGVRIGVATVKGLAFAQDKPCIAVSTLEAMAYNMIGVDCVVFALMDARRNQVYNAVFENSAGEVKRLCEDRAVAIESLKAELEKMADKTVYFVGDGAKIAYDMLSDEFKFIRLAPENVRYQNAVGVAMAAQNKPTCKASSLLPSYLRLSQAERELKLKK